MAGFWSLFSPPPSPREPFPRAWRAIVRRNVPYYARLPAQDQRELEDRTRLFLAEKSFEGCGGLRLTDEIRVTVAAQACVLLLRLDALCFPRLRCILVYPHPYWVRMSERNDLGLVEEGYHQLSGLTSSLGNIVLTWDRIRPSGRQAGRNLVLHEFAHQLARETGAPDGIPMLADERRYKVFRRALGAAQARGAREAAAGRATFLRSYAAVNPAEFFAVLTESFFEDPGGLKAAHPGLYVRMRRFYRQDPAQS
jgi:MtfA peptidase